MPSTTFSTSAINSIRTPISSCPCSKFTEASAWIYSITRRNCRSSKIKTTRFRCSAWRRNKLFPRMRLLKSLSMGIVSEPRIKRRLMTPPQDHMPSAQLASKSGTRLAGNFFWSISRVRSAQPIASRTIDREDLKAPKSTSPSSL